MATKECPNCAIEVDVDAEVCPYCGYEFPTPSTGKKIMVWLMIFLLFVWLVF